MSPQHAVPATRRRSVLLLGSATVLGLWFGLRAPDVSPASAPAPAVQAPTVADVPVVPDPDDQPAPRGDGG